MPPVIRPYSPPPAPSTTPSARAPAETRAAQRAFFQQALGDSTPVRTAPPASAPVINTAAKAAPQPTRTLGRPLPDEPPARIMRPGSFVDVKV